MVHVLHAKHGVNPYSLCRQCDAPLSFVSQPHLHKPCSPPQCTLFSGFAVLKLKQKQSEPMHCAPPSSVQLRLHTPDNPPQCTRPPPPLRCRCCTHPRQQPPQLPKSHSCFETRGPIGPLPDCVGGCGCGGGGVGGGGVSWGCRGGRLVLVRGPQRAFHRSWTG
jgi:hypothetical protein